MHGYDQRKRVEQPGAVAIFFHGRPNGKLDFPVLELPLDRLLSFGTELERDRWKRLLQLAYLCGVERSAKVGGALRWHSDGDGTSLGGLEVGAAALRKGKGVHGLFSTAQKKLSECRELNASGATHEQIPA